MRRTALFALLAAATFATPAGAQVLGTFYWQTQPFCNRVTVTVTQMGSIYQLIGHDNLCGAGSAPVTGTAAPATGAVALGFTVWLPSGKADHISAVINLTNLSGTWVDADGHTGTFAYAANLSGSPRPAPASATNIMVSQFAASIYGGSGSAATLARSDHTHDDRYFTESEVNGFLAGVVSGGNGDGVGGTVCSSSTAIEIYIKNGRGEPVDARFSFVVPEFAYGQIRSDASIRNASSNLSSVEHPEPGAYCLNFSTTPPQAQSESTVLSIHANR